MSSNSPTAAASRAVSYDRCGRQSEVRHRTGGRRAAHDSALASRAHRYHVRCRSRIRRLARTSPDTVEAHWKLAEWCREHKLATDRSSTSRGSSSSIRTTRSPHPVRLPQTDGQWMTRDDVMASRGMVMYDGRYVTPQHVSCWNGRRRQRLRRPTGPTTSSACGAGSPAGGPIGRPSPRRNSGDPRPGRRRAVVDAHPPREGSRAEAAVARSGRHGSTISWHSTRSSTCRSPIPTTSSAAEPRVPRSGRPARHRHAVHPRTEEPRQRNHQPGRRRLGQIGDPDAIGPLIDALVTKHKIQISEGRTPTSTPTHSREGGGFSFGGKAPQVSKPHPAKSARARRPGHPLRRHQLRLRPSPVAHAGWPPRRSTTRRRRRDE